MAAWYNQQVDEVLNKLETDGDSGLTEEAAAERIRGHGPNEITETGKRTVRNMIIDQFKDFMVIILIIAALISAFLREIADSAVIMAIVVLNAVLGVIQEYRAEKSLAALKQMASPQARVLRSGKRVIIRTSDIVPGDIIFIEAGDLIPVDGRLIETARLKVEEAALTGESFPVEKTEEVIHGTEVPLGDRKNMVFSGSTAVYGRGTLVATATGMDTELGKIADLLQGEPDAQTPLQKRLGELGKKLGLIAVVMSLLIFLLGIFKGELVLEMFLTAVSLAVAVIPEGLPATVTVVLAVGVQRMIKKNAIIRKLPAVETLGAATVICSDKTGTLTQNRMTVEQVWTRAGDAIELDGSPLDNQMASLVLKAGTLASDAKLTAGPDGRWEVLGDPTEAAIVIAAANLGLIKPELEREAPRVYEIPFDSDRKLMTTVHQTPEGFTAYTKGAPDVLAGRCVTCLAEGAARRLTAEESADILEHNRIMAEKGLRVLGVASREVSGLGDEIVQSMETELTFLGLIGMMDPPRAEAAEAVRKTVEAGIRPCMITGDHGVTAMAIAARLGMAGEGSKTVSGSVLEQMSDDELADTVMDYSVFSRVSPEHKLRIVKALQRNNQVVAMTGDGVNDAPALKRADIGAAMGITGTDVAKQASDMVLTDDNYATIVAAVEEGRSIYANIKKTVNYLLSCNAGEILVLFLALLFGWPRPLLPIQILWVNLVTDSLPGLALGLEPPGRDVMKQPPRNPKERILNKAVGIRLLLEGTMIAAVTLFAFFIGLQAGVEQARTMAFLTLSFSQKTHAFNKRSDTESLWSIGWFSNMYLVAGVLVSTLIQLSVVFVPFLQSLFRVTFLDWEQWIAVILLSLFPLVIVEGVKGLHHLRRRFGGVYTS